MKNSIIVLLFLGVLSFSCSNSTASDETEKISLPLKIGNSWTYNVIHTSYSDSIPQIVKESEVTFIAISDTLVDENKWFLISSDNQSLNRLMSGFYSNQKDGIHFIRSFENTSIEKKSSELLPLTNYSFLSKSKEVESERHPFLHHPDIEVPERLIKNENIIASVTYGGESMNEGLDVTTQNYVWNYYQQTVATRTYTFAPFDQHYSISNEVGLTVFEGAYASTKGSTEDDPRLRLIALFRFELTEFNEN